ncbi:MAG: hypothetical protein Q9213_002083 [Squamulea squamosa]
MLPRIDQYQSPLQKTPWNKRTGAIDDAMEKNKQHLTASQNETMQSLPSQHVADLHIPKLNNRSQLDSSGDRRLDHMHDNIDIMMGEDPNSYLPKDGQLRSLCDQILYKINLAVETWVRATGHGPPRFVEAVSDAASFHLLKRIYSVGTEREMLYKITCMTKRCPIDIEVALRALVGSGVFEWVFEERHRSLNSAGNNSQKHQAVEERRTGYPAMLHLQPSDGHPRLLQQLSAISPQLRTQLERKSMYYYVQEDVNVDNHAGQLAWRMSLALTTFDLDNTGRWSKDDNDTWLRHLGGVFGTAIRLKLLTCLQPDAFDFRWPQAMGIFDSQWMQDDKENPTDSAWPVYVALFPALLRNNEAMSRDLSQTELPVFPAVVLRKPL